MNTLLVNTSGRSRFRTNTNLAGTGSAINITVNNIDGQPELFPNRIIDVVRDFSWYAGPKATDLALDKVPCIFLTEREQLLSSLISGAMYYLRAGTQALEQVLESNYVRSLLANINVSPDIKKGINKASDLINSVTKGLTNSSDQELLEQHNLKSLTGIYFTRETGFKYRLPIYGSPSDVTSKWGQAEGGAGVNGVVNKVVGGAQDFVDNIAQFVNLAQPGVYIEKPKYFTGYDNGPTRSITFPLVNTVRRTTDNPIQQNYELLWLLAFQNKAYKTSFSRTPPPKIYTVSVPGQFSMPYAFISNMKVEFLGSVRKSAVYIPSGTGTGAITSKRYEVPVPDAYQVTLEFTSLIGDYGNVMMSNAFNSQIQDDVVLLGQKEL